MTTATTQPEPAVTIGPVAQSPRPGGIDLDWLASKIEYRRFQECIHCGLCTASCPTFLETGNENDGPRGRIYLMRAVVDGRLAMSEDVAGHLELCLDCRACETACPSGVKYGQMIEPFKVAIARMTSLPSPSSWLQRAILHHLFPYAGRVRFALAPARLFQRIGLIDAMDRIGLTRLLPPTLRRMQDLLPARMQKPRSELPEILPPIGPKRATVALFLGCVADAMMPETTAATVRVLQKNGCEVHIPRGQVCCGAIHYHSGSEQPALEFARANLTSFDLERIDAIIVNAAGCGAMLRDYGHLLADADHEHAARFASKVRDISEFLVELGPIPPTQAIGSQKVTYHDACHLCHAQGVRSQPRRLLQMIPGLQLIPLDESEICCGAAGTYNLSQPEMSRRLGIRKREQIEKTGAQVVATGNIGCIMQIARQLKEVGSDVKVMHPIDLLDRAYGE
jgi:glycolate dehydrogenase iron-sulfur subunit